MPADGTSSARPEATTTLVLPARALRAASARPHLPLPPPVCSAPPLPQGPCPVCPRLDQDFEPWRQAGYWQAQHRRACERETKLQQRVAELEAEIRDLRHRLFGRSSEAGAATASEVSTVGTTDATRPGVPARPRGQQRGHPGPQRRDYSHLPAVEEDRDLPADQQACPHCGQPFAPFPGTEDSTLLEIEVRAHRRLIHRRRYRPTCRCPDNAGIITAPPPPKVIPKSILGVSIWVTVLLDKYLFYRPTYRLLADLRTYDLDLSLGTLTEGLQHLLPLLSPVYEALVTRCQQQTLWHADETRWLVFATVEGKVGYRWYLWVFHAPEVVVFVLAAGRAHDVPEDHLGPQAQGIMVVDRYKAYQAIDQVKRGQIILAFCWAHQRRDFLEVARSWPEQQAWAFGWIEGIAALYRLNEARLAVPSDAAAFAMADQALRGAVTAMEVQAQAELAQAALHPARRKVLESLGDHWTGLTVFVEHPEVPMDNNTAERAERGPVVGRKNYYGSGAVWAGRLAAMLFSLLQTLCLWGLNPRAWLTWYLTACAEVGGKAPTEIGTFLPWNLSAAQRQGLSVRGEGQDTSGKARPADTS